MSSEEELRRNQRRSMGIRISDLISEPPFQEVVYDDWTRPGLNIQIPESVINVIVVETVRRMIKAELKTEMKLIVKNELKSLIVLPISIIMTIFSSITALVLIFLGTWITSIPFILTAIFGGYFYYMNRK